MTSTDDQHTISVLSTKACQLQRWKSVKLLGMRIVNYRLGDGTLEWLHKCEECGQYFAKKWNLNQHQLIHTGARPHKCEECDKTFTRRSHLNQHMVVHTGERPHKCDECGKYFSQKGHLNQHVLKHSGVQPHQCNECGRLFTEKGTLNKHMLVHTGERPHKCEECGKLFALKGTLNKHMLTHTGDRPHKCCVCGKAFTQRGNLSKHMLVHTGERPYGCNVCGKLFAQKVTLDKHTRVHIKKGHKVRPSSGSDLPLIGNDNYGDSARLDSDSESVGATRAIVAEANQCIYYVDNIVKGGNLSLKDEGNREDDEGNNSLKLESDCEKINVEPDIDYFESSN